MFWRRKRKQSGTGLQAVQSCVGLKERGALSLLKVKIASLATMTYSHEFSTSPTAWPSPPWYTQQLFRWSTIGYIQCRYECLKTRMRVKMLQGSWGDIPRRQFKQHCTFLTVPFWGFAEPGCGWTNPRCVRFWPKQLLTVIDATANTFSSKTHYFFFFNKTKQGLYTEIKIRGEKWWQ